MESEIKIHTCEYCDIPYTSAIELDEHIMNEHDNIDVKCDICGAQYYSNKLYSEHLLDHDQE